MSFLTPEEGERLNEICRRHAQEILEFARAVEAAPEAAPRTAGALAVQGAVVNLGLITDDPNEVMAGLARAVGSLCAQQASPLANYLEFDRHVRACMREILDVEGMPEQ